MDLNNVPLGEVYVGIMCQLEKHKDLLGIRSNNYVSLDISLSNDYTLFITKIIIPNEEYYEISLQRDGSSSRPPICIWIDFITPQISKCLYDKFNLLKKEIESKLANV